MFQKNLNEVEKTIPIPIPIDISWQDIDTVILDMDGTLLDLAFDSHFWKKIVPETLSEQRAISLEEALLLIRQEEKSVQHTLNWYCLDYWSERLRLDICAMITAYGPNAELREDTVPFLDSLKACGKRRILLTNAHPHSLRVKLEHTSLAQHFDLLLSTHAFGYPKEDLRLWQAVAEYIGLDPFRTLLVDDTESILDTAAKFGIRYCLGVINPDSKQADKTFQRHPALNHYRVLHPNLHRP